MSEAGGDEKPLEIFIIAGESSGDMLGAGLMQALRAARPDAAFRGVGGPAMAGQGLQSLFPLADIAVMGFLPVLARLPKLLQRIRATADAVLASPPDVLVIVDSPDFTHRVAQRVRKARPDIPIVDYVSPTVWAWRPGRAKKMRPYIDLLLALLPFEPDAHRRLGGPPCVYAGHPLTERLHDLQPATAQEAQARETGPPTILILPGSRRSEIARLLDVFGQTVERLHQAFPTADFVLPAVAHLQTALREQTASWPVQPRIVIGEQEKFAAFRRARAALAASGTVTLELALARVPAVVGYRVSKLEEWIVRALTTAPSFVLSNIILGENAVPGHVQEACNPQTLAGDLIPLIRGGAERDRQCAALARLADIMRLPAGETPSLRAASEVLGVLDKKKGRAAATLLNARSL